MNKQYGVMVLGASYGALLGTKLLMAGHRVKLVCLPDEADLINREGIRVRVPVRGRDGLVEVDSRKLPGTLSAGTPDRVDPQEFDLVGLAMQEPQYRAPEVRALLESVASARVPCMSIMNMPPLAYLARIPGLDVAMLRDCYTDASVWDILDPALVTLASPDPQAFRPPEEPTNILQVSLPTNFKVARFESDSDTQILRDLQADIEAARLELDGESVELPVKLKVHDSVFVPLAKWSMLLTGNYRCVQPDSARSIRDAVHSDAALSASVYAWVRELCIRIGADEADLVPFEKYANAAMGLEKPSSAARALFAGAPNIERVDRLVKTIADSFGLHNETVDEIVSRVDARLEANRRQAA
jgi:hypothetical protein